MADTNKIKYGLKNVYYAIATIDPATGAATYGDPVAFKGAKSISMEPQGDTNTFYADDIAYWTGNSNAGYQGDLEMAYITDAVRTALLGEAADSTTGLQYETVEAGADPVHFALMFEFSGDKHAVRHVLYNCTAARPSVAGDTKEESIDPATESLTVTATSVYVAAISKNVVRGKMNAGDTGYETFFSAVVQPTK